MRRINYHFETSETGRYVALEVGEKQTPLWHQIEMISNNPELGLALPLFMEKGDKSYFSYKIEVPKNKSLSAFLEETEISPTDFCLFVRDLLMRLSEAEHFLLDKNGFLLNPDLIFVGEDLRDTAMIYFPCKSTVDLNAECRELLADLITCRVRFSSGGEFMVATLLNYYKSHDFNIYGLGEICEALLREKAEPLPFARDSAAPGLPISPKKSTGRFDLEHSQAAQMPGDEASVGEADGSQKGSHAGDAGEKAPIDAVVKMQPIFAVAAILLLITPISNYITFLGPNPKPILFFILAAFDLLLVFFFRSGAKEKGVRPNKKGAVIDPQEKTMLLTNIKINFGYFIEKNIPNGLRFELNALMIIVGREGEEVDLFCENMAVGKRHAQLHFHDGAYYVSDLNSKNGTFVNGVRLEQNQEKQIKHGDEICFANSTFVFERGN